MNDEAGDLTPTGNGCGACGMGGLVCSAHPDRPSATTTGRPDACECGAEVMPCRYSHLSVISLRVVALVNAALGAGMKTVEAVAEEQHNPVDHPSHYTSHPSGVECITVTEHMGFTLGNALKYIWRADLKGDAIEDLRKARWYIDREIARRGGETP